MEQPVIIVGMHRSGTSLCARILNEAGVFLGKDMSAHYESLFFQSINSWLFKLLGGRWDCPPNFNLIIEDEFLHSKITDKIEKRLKSYELINYLGFKKFVFKPEIIWGWKDPRNVFTIPIWEKIFPNAKFIYLERHGVDVAYSLQRRSKRLLESSSNKVFEKKFYLKEYERSSISIRCYNLREAFTLWKEYVKTGRDNLKKIDDDQIFKIKFENLVRYTDASIQSMFSFLGMQIDKKLKNKLSGQIKKEKAYAYEQNDSLKPFVHKVKNDPLIQSYE